MKSKVGLWIDHRNAILVTLVGSSGELTRLESGVEKRVRYSGASKEPPEDQRDRRFVGHLNRYYDKVIASIRDAEEILILGPGEAKGELKERIGKEGLGRRIVGIETVDKMTEPQVAARVRLHFLKKTRKLPRRPAA